MVVGNVVKVPTSIFDPAYPLPALIANNYGEMMSIPMYDAALMGAALMFAFTLGTSPVFFAVAYLTMQLGARLEKWFLRFVAVVMLVLGFR